MIDSGPAMMLTARTVSIFVPDNLLPVLTAFIKNASDMREAMKTNLIDLSTDVHARADIVLIPSLESALQWGYDRNIHWPLAVAHASVFLGLIAEISTRSGVAVIREQDLELRPNRVLQIIADRIDFFRGAEMETPHVPIRHRVGSEDLPSKISPLRMYGEIPILKGAWAYWPSYLFWTYDGPCPDSIDLMGRSRLLFYGPFIVLAPGTWRVELVFELTEEAVLYDYYIEIGGADRFERIAFRAESAGRQVVKLQYIARDHRHVEIKVGLSRAAFHGELKLAGAWIVRAD